ncbi:MAG: hypothetical protein AAFV87_07220 [Pseudomonadota bacterium]
MESVDDPSGFIAQCVRDLLQVGFDASAFETAKWAGLACLIVLALLITAAFVARFFKTEDMPPPVTENQFKWVLIVGAVLIALPVVAKVTSDQFEVNFASDDRTFAQRICEEQLEATAQTAEVDALETRLNALVDQIAALTARGLPENGEGLEAPVIVAPRSQNADLLGQAVSVFYRPAQESRAQEVSALLKANGAGVGLRETDLTNTNFAESALSGEVYLLYDNRAFDAEQAIRETLEEAGIVLRDARNVSTLKGNALQILIF